MPQRGYTIYLIGDDDRPWLRDAYHTFLRVPWSASLAFIAISFLLMNVVFAAVYLAVGGVAGVREGSFFDALSFSVQTMSTVGYGVAYPQSGGANTVMILESVTGIIVTALATGLVFAKFSRATARLAFSKVAVITAHDGRPTLMFRIGNRRGNTIFDAQVRVVCSKLIKTAEGENFYKMFDMHMVRDRQPGLKRGWQVMHVIDDASPLAGMDAEGLRTGEVELSISLSGVDETSMQSVTVMHDYVDGEIRFDHKFADTLTPLANGDLLFDQSQFDVLVPAPAPQAARASVPA
jgi:inward rectifier potassium channel